MQSRPLTADLRGIADDGRRWWGVSGNGYGTPWFYPARSGRQAVAQHRRESIAADRAQGHSLRSATLFARSLGLTHTGPHTTREAFVLDAGWHLGLAVCNAYRGLILNPAGPITDLTDCEPMLTHDRVESILDLVARHYRPDNPIGPA